MLSGTAFWFDADDASSITESGGAVSQWDDQTGAYSAVQATGSRQPTYTASGFNSSYGQMSFDGDDAFEIDGGLSGSADDWAFLYFGTSVDSPSAVPFLFDNATSRLIPSLDRTNKIVYLDGAAWVEGSTRKIGDALVAWNMIATDASVINLDGVEILSGGDYDQLAMGGQTAIGSRYNYDAGSCLTNGTTITHLVLVKGGVTAEELQKLEGWAAWSRGYASLLPVGHPYKDAAPISDATPPTNVSSAIAYADTVGSVKDLFFGWTDGTDETEYAGATAGYTLSGSDYWEQTDGTFSSSLTAYKKRSDENGAGRCAAAAPGVSTSVTAGKIRAWDAAENYSDLAVSFFDVSGGDVAPTAATLTVQDDQDGNSATATITGSSQGSTSNRVYTALRGVGDWTLSATITGNGSDTLTLTPGEYMAITVPYEGAVVGLASGPSYFHVSTTRSRMERIRDRMAQVVLRQAEKSLYGLSVEYYEYPGATPVTIKGILDPDQFRTSFMGQGVTDLRTFTITVPRQTGFPPTRFKTGHLIGRDSVKYSIDDVEFDAEEESKSPAFRFQCSRYDRDSVEFDGA